MPIRKGLRGGDFLRAQRCQRQGVKRLKILPRPLLNWQAFSVRWGFIGQERLGFGAKPQEEKLLKFNSKYSNAWLDWACQLSLT